MFSFIDSCGVNAKVQTFKCSIIFPHSLSTLHPNSPNPSSLYPLFSPQAKRIIFPVKGRHSFEEMVANPWISHDQALRKMSHSVYPSGSRAGGESQWGGSRWGVRLRYIGGGPAKRQRSRIGRWSTPESANGIRG